MWPACASPAKPGEIVLRYRARDVGVVLVPRVETIERILDIGEVYLGLQRPLQRRACRFERRPQLFEDQKFGLLADLDAGPGGMPRDMPTRVEPQPGIVRHLARNEDKVVADDRRHKAGGWRRGNARRMDFVDLVPG